jgi:hypothetical protein
MIEIIKKYLKIDPDQGKTLQFNRELDLLVEYFINTYIKKSKEAITQLSTFKDKFDFTYTTPSGLRSLLVFHKRYDGLDITAKIDALKNEKVAKEAELKKLTDGYSIGKTYKFGKVQLEQYLTNLKKAIDTVNGYVGRGNIGAPNSEALKDILIENILNKVAGGTFEIVATVPQQIPLDTDDFDITDTLKLSTSRLHSEGNFISGGQPKAEIKDRIQARYHVIQSFLTTIIEKIDKLNAEIAKIDSQIAELTAIIRVELFEFKDEPPAGSKISVKDLIKDNSAIITEMQQELIKRVIVRYNRFQNTLRSPELIGQYTEADTAIDIILDELGKLDNMVVSSTPSADEILNITSRIKNSVNKLFSAKTDIPRSINDKLNKIIKISNDIKFSIAFKSEFFKEPATGILVEYDKNQDPNDEYTRQVISTLNQEKYSNFKKIIDFIKEKFLRYELFSLNPKLKELMEKYFKNESNDFYDKVVKPAIELHTSGTIGGVKPTTTNLEENEKLWDVSVSRLKSATGGNEYEILVYMELIEGELNDKNKSDIKCQYLDEELIRRFEELMDEDPSYGPNSKPKVFSIKKAKEEKVKQEQEKKAEIASVLSTPAKDTNIQEPRPILAQGGKRHTKSFRSSKKKKTKKMRKYTY